MRLPVGLPKGCREYTNISKLKMCTAKEEVKKILNRIPDDSSLDEIQYHIYVLMKIKQGLKDIEEGRVLTQEDVELRMAKWLEK